MIEYDGDTNEVYLYDEIGPDEYGLASAKQMVAALKAAKGADITLRINSPGGSVTEATAMVEALRRYKGEVNVEIDAIAASASTLVALAGNSVGISANAFYMIHMPWSFAIGPASEMRKTADILDKFAVNLAQQYATATGKPVDEVMELMAAETWYNAEEAVANGFAHRITDGVEVAANIRRGLYAKAPDKLFDSPAVSAREKRLRLLRLQ
jgi:ATP-dependent protease ClpP protease subunit